MKAVVLEVRGREAALLMTDGTVRVARGRYEVGQEVDYVEPARASLRQWVAAVVVAALLLGVSAGMWIDANYVAYAEVSLDVNPSIVYRLNRRNRVLSVAAANADAEPLVDALEGSGIRFQPLTDAVARTMDILTEEGYLSDDQDDYVLASVVSDDASVRETLAGQVEAAIERTREDNAALEYRIDRVDRATAREARDNGMSPGRYEAWKASDREEDAEAFAEKPVRELFREKEQEQEQGRERGTEAPGAAQNAGETRDRGEVDRRGAEQNGEQADRPGEAQEQAPEPVEKPETEQEPEATEKPEAEQAPEPAEKPEAEQAPEAAEIPEEKSEPEPQAQLKPNDKPAGEDEGPAKGGAEKSSGGSDRPAEGGNDSKSSGGNDRPSDGSDKPSGGAPSKGGSEGSRGGGGPGRGGPGR